MILTRLKDHLVANGKTSRAELAKKFGLSEDGIDAMLGLWIGKGKVSKVVSKGSKKAVLDDPVYYRWNEELELAITVFN